jgi:hypothetical protein
VSDCDLYLLPRSAVAELNILPVSYLHLSLILVHVLQSYAKELGLYDIEGFQ